jgi:hypothetical protein
MRQGSAMLSLQIKSVIVTSRSGFDDQKAELAGIRALGEVSHRAAVAN